MYVICWKSRVTGATGRGTNPLDAEAADIWVTKLNADFPDLEHWKEPV